MFFQRPKLHLRVVSKRVPIFIRSAQDQKRPPKKRYSGKDRFNAPAIVINQKNSKIFQNNLFPNRLLLLAAT